MVPADPAKVSGKQKGSWFAQRCWFKLLSGSGGGGTEDRMPQSHSREVAVKTYPEFKAI